MTPHLPAAPAALTPNAATGIPGIPPPPPVLIRPPAPLLPTGPNGSDDDLDELAVHNSELERQLAPYRDPSARPCRYVQCVAGYGAYDRTPAPDMIDGFEGSGYEDIWIPWEIFHNEYDRFQRETSLIPSGVERVDMMLGIFEGVYRGYLEVDRCRMVLVKTPLGQAFDRVHAAKGWGNLGMEHMDTLAKAIIYLENRDRRKIHVVDQHLGGTPLPDAQFEEEGRICNLEVECSTLRTKPEQVLKNLQKAREESTPVLFVVPTEELWVRLRRLFAERAADAILGKDFSVLFRDEMGWVHDEGEGPHGGLFPRLAPAPPVPSAPAVEQLSPRPPNLHDELIRVLSELRLSSVWEASPTEVLERISPEMLAKLPGGERAHLTIIGRALADLEVPSRRGWRGPTRVTFYLLKDWHPAGAGAANVVKPPAPSAGR